MSLEQRLQLPLRYPEENAPKLMAKRARWLVILGFLLPGSAQILAGNKKLGRFGLGATVALLVMFALVLVGMLLWRGSTINLLSHPWALLAIQLVVGAYVLLWLVLGFDTLRLTKLIKVDGGWRVPVVLLSVLLTLLPVAAGGWMYSALNTGRQVVSKVFVDRPAVEPDANNRYNILLLGTDAGADREGVRPDSVTLVSVDADTGQSVLIGLPRELAAMQFKPESPMYENHPLGFGVTQGCFTGTCWLNSLYAEAEIFQPELYPDAVAKGSSPGIEATKDAVAGSTGLDVHFYVLLNMEGFTDLIDALGGVEINVKERLPIGGDAYGNGVEGYIEVGQQKLNGWQALWYARSRYGSLRGDYDRMERQRELQSAILAQMSPQNVLLNFEAILASGSHFAETDLPRSMIGTLSDLALNAKEFEPVRVELTPPAIVTENPDYDKIRSMVADAIAQASGGTQ